MVTRSSANAQIRHYPKCVLMNKRMGGGMQVNTTTVRNYADCASNASHASNDLVKNKFR